jgi:uncharacterized membrane protein YgcG
MTVSLSFPCPNPIGLPGTAQTAANWSSKSLLIGTAIVGAAIALASHASASGQDDNFLALLAQAGIPAHDGIPGVISTGHRVCDALDSGESASAIADELANYAYAESPSNPLDQHRRTMARFVRVSAQAFCPGHASSAAAHGGYHIVLIGLAVPHPPPGVAQVPDMANMTPPVVVAKPKQNPPPEQKPPPPPEVVPPPSQGLQGGQGKGGTGSGIDGGGSSGGGGVQPAPEPPEGHIELLP